MTDYLQAGDTVVSSEGAQKYTIVRFVGSGASSAAYLADCRQELNTSPRKCLGFVSPCFSVLLRA